MEVGGCDLVKLARRHGTPLYVYDEATVRQRASEYVAAIGSAGQVLYSAKAFASPRFLRIVAEEGLGLALLSACVPYLSPDSRAKRDLIHLLVHNSNRARLRRPDSGAPTAVIP